MSLITHRTNKSNVAESCTQRREEQLNDQIATISAQVRISTKNARKLRDRRLALIARLNDASSGKADGPLAAGSQPRNQTTCNYQSSGKKKEGSEPAPEASGHGQEPPEPSVRQSAKHTAAPGEPAAVQNTPWLNHCEQVSLPQILQFLQQTADACDKRLAPFEPLARAISDYQSQVCSNLKLSPRNVSWFVTFPLSTIPLAFSSDVSTCECILSLAFAWHSLSVESMFLVREHAVLSPAATPAHSYLQPRNTDSKPAAPDADILQHAFLRCGVNERRSLAEVVGKVLPLAALC